MRDYQTKANQGALPDSNTATKYGAGEVNSLRTEAKNAVSRAGLVLAPQDGTGEDTTQLAQALLINAVAGQAFQDNGAVNVITLTPLTGANGLLLPPNYNTLDGAHFTFFAAFDNTGATTVSAGQTIGTQIGAKALVREDGTALIGGEITTLVETEVFYDLSNDRFVLVRGAFQSAGSSGKVGQVLQVAKTDTVVQSATQTWAAISGLSQAITPSDVASKVLITIDIMSSINTGAGNANFFRILRDGVPIAVGDVAGSRAQISAIGAMGNAVASNGASTNGMTFLDEPATVASVTYSVQWRQATTTGFGQINRDSDDTDAADHPRGISTLTVTEILP